MNYGIIDGGRFYFRNKTDGNMEMVDNEDVFDTIELPSNLGHYLAEVLWEHHTMKQDRSNMFAKLSALIELVQNTEMDKDVLIACINNCGVG